jgi:hypothetical protein
LRPKRREVLFHRTLWATQKAITVEMQL